MDNTAPYRWGLVYAATWRIITELVRRHGAAEDLGLFQLHPGLSGDGIFTLTSLSRWHARQLEGTGGEIWFGLGGGHRGSLGVPHSFDSPGAAGTSDGDDGFSYVDAFLRGHDPIEVVNEVERLAGLPANRQVPASTPRDVTYRVIAELLERRALARTGFSVFSGYMDSSNGCSLCDWVRECTWAQRAAAGIDEADYLALSDVGGHFLQLGPAQVWDPQPRTPGLLYFDSKEGEAWQRGRYETRINLMALYKQAGRQLRPVVDAADALSWG